MKNLIAIAALLGTTATVLAMDPSEMDHYKQWIGCLAPQITFDWTDTTDNAPPSYAGKKVLLYSFFSGAFAQSPNDPPMADAYIALRALRKVRAAATNHFEVVGYSRGFAMHKLKIVELPQEMISLVDFPVVNLNDRHGEHSLPEPFDLLFTPGAGILIDTNGIICGIFFPKMSESEFEAVANATPCEEPARPSPAHNATAHEQGSK